MPIGGAAEIDAEIAECLDARGEEAGLCDLDDLDLLMQALLGGLAPEGGEIRRDREGVDDFDAFLLEGGDLAGEIGRAGLIGAWVDDAR